MIPNFVLSSIAAIAFGFFSNFLRSIFVMVSPLITKKDLSLINFPACLIAPPVPSGVSSIENLIFIPNYFS